MRTLPKIAPEDPRTLKAILDLTRFTGQNFAFFTKKGFVTNTPFREDGLGLLGELAEAQPDFRKEIISPVVTILKDAVQRTSSSSAKEVLRAIAEVDEAGNTLVKCGPEARQTLTKDVLPRMKDLQFHKSEVVRKSAENLRKKIEDAP